MIVYIDTDNVHEAVAALEAVADHLAALEAEQETAPRYLYCDAEDVTEVAPDRMNYVAMKPCGCIGDYIACRDVALFRSAALLDVVTAGLLIEVVPPQVVKRRFDDTCPVCAPQMELPLGEVA